MGDGRQEQRSPPVSAGGVLDPGDPFSSDGAMLLLFRLIGARPVISVATSVPVCHYAKRYTGSINQQNFSNMHEHIGRGHDQKERLKSGVNTG